MKATLILTCFEGNPPKRISDVLDKVSTNSNSYLRGFVVNKTGVTCVHDTLNQFPECDTIWILSDNFLSDRRCNDFFDVLKNSDQLLVALHKGAQLYDTTKDKLKALCNFISDIYITDTHHVPGYPIPDLCSKIVGRALVEDTSRVLELHEELNSFIYKHNTYQNS